MARATGAGAYSRNSLGIVIAFGIAVSTVLGRFVIPIYYVLGERLIDFFARLRGAEDDSHAHSGHRPAAGHGHAQPHREGVEMVRHAHPSGSLTGHDGHPGTRTTERADGGLPPRAYRPDGVSIRDIEDDHVSA